MENPKVLFISGSLGLGHVTRDLAIARELRKKFPGMKINWLAAHPDGSMLQNAGEKVLPEAAEYANENEPAEQSSNGISLNLLTNLMKAKNAWKQNIKVFEKLVTKNHFDLVIDFEMHYSKTTPELLAEKITELTGSKVNYPDLPVNGAQKAAELISTLLT